MFLTSRALLHLKKPALNQSFRMMQMRHSFRTSMYIGCQPQMRCFATATKPETVPNSQSGSKSRKISSKILCDITGTRYYQHNEEVNYVASKVVKLFDENNVDLGEMKFGEAYNLAMELEKDIVLRNDKTNPPVMKIMNYRLELLKRLFKKLGKEIN